MSAGGGAAGTRRPRLGPPHGFGDDELSRRLRRRPPAQALEWVQRSLGGSVRAVRAYRGGSSSAVHALRLERDGRVEAVVLRRYVLESLEVEGPDLATREAHVLRLLDRSQVIAPRLLAVDPTGESAGVPSLVMTRIPGRLDWSPAELEPWLHRLAAALLPLHDSPITAADGVQAFVPYAPRTWARPAWVSPRLWERALEVFHGPRLDPDVVFLHRDYHPGNVLWRRGRVTGVVDWQAASVGPRAVDVWHCRANLLARFGLDVAERFLDIWASVSGADYHPWSEAVMLVDAVGWLSPVGPQEQHDLVRLLERRLAELGCP